MKKQTVFQWVFLMSLVGLATVLSCTSEFPIDGYGRQARKEKQDRHKNTELTKSAARQWYEANYEPVVATRANYEDTTVCMMKPKWENAKESNRRRYEVVEMPILVHGGRIMLDAETAQKWKPGMKSKFIRNTAKIVVEKDKLTGRIRSFVMIFIGSYDYLKKTKSMGKNTYLYRQPDFDGSVLFYEINGTFINGWKYEKGKIVASIAPKIDEENGGPKENNATSRAIVEDCTDYCYTVYDEECYEETWYDYDDEYGWEVGVTYGCYTISWEECTTHCTYYDDGSDDEDDNWDEDFPAGGSNTSNNTGKNNNDNDEKVDDRETLFEESMKEVKVILKNLGIDVDQYTIKLNTEMCGTNARVMNDGTTIELCTRALTKYTHNDQASIIWHEIYHVDHGHYEGINPTTPCDPPLVLEIDDEIQPYFELYLNNEYDGYGTKEDYALGMLLTENALHTAEWYENEIETYNAELDNNIPRSENYEADMHFCLWKYQQIYEYLTKE